MICERCEGGGAYSKLADCTTTGPDCACNGASVIVDPCDYCHGRALTTITIERWRKELCDRYDQGYDDPDQFWMFQPTELRKLIDNAKAEFGSDPVEVEVED